VSRPSRRLAREAALQLLYQVDLTGDSGEKAFDAYWDSWPDVEKDPRTREFAEQIVRFVLSDGERIDAAIDAAAKNWDLERFSRVDLNLLRLAVAELLGSPEVPAPVVINEAVEIARRFSDEKAAAFINGVLDRVARDAGRIEGGQKAPRAPRVGAESTVPVTRGSARTPRTAKTARTVQGDKAVPGDRAADNAKTEGSKG
jgi:N utilization substance protein B